jgi:hypothetical protein
VAGDEVHEDEDEEFDAEQAERDIAAFIVAADELEGPSTAEIAERVEVVMATAWEQIAQIVDGQANNKVVATMLLLSRQARESTPEDPRQWQLHAASSLVGAMIPNARVG